MAPHHNDCIFEGKAIVALWGFCKETEIGSLCQEARCIGVSGHHLQIAIAAAQQGGQAEGAGAAWGDRGGPGRDGQLRARPVPARRGIRGAAAQLHLVQAAPQALQVPLLGRQEACPCSRRWRCCCACQAQARNLPLMPLVLSGGSEDHVVASLKQLRCRVICMLCVAWHPDMKGLLESA